MEFENHDQGPANKKKKTKGNASKKSAQKSGSGIGNSKKTPTSDIIEDNRRSGQATRTLKACDTCRKQKVRCINYENSDTCVRCSYLNKPCSFVAHMNSNPTPVTNDKQKNSTIISKSPPNLSNSSGEFNSNDTNGKLDMIYNGVNELLYLMKNNKEINKSDISNNDARLLLEAASSMQKSSLPGTPSFQANDPKFYGFPSLSGQLQSQSQFQTSNLSNFIQSNEALDEQDQNTNEEDEELQTSFKSPAISQKTSPFSIIHNQNNVSDIPQPLLNLLHLSTTSNSKRNQFYDYNEDVISLGILNELETIDLINDFRRNYGRWVSFPLSIPTGVLIERIRFKSSLLLTTCCCLSLRYSLNGDMSPGDIDNFKRKKKTYNQLMKQLVRDIDKSLLKYSSFQGSQRNSGDIEFLQALVILSIYSLSLSSIVSNTTDKDSNELIDEDFDLQELNLDPWFFSSIGLSIFITKSTFGSLFRNIEAEAALQKDQEANNSNTSNILGESQLSPFTILYDELDSNEYQTLTILRIYNHLTLVHLINCVFSGRMCVLDEIRLNYCTTTLSLPSSTNFDGRMVSEIGILLIAYNYIQVNLNAGVIINLQDCESSFKSVKEEIDLWYEQWEYLFNQPALQFVEFCYDFCYILVYYNYNYKKSLIQSRGNNPIDQDNLESLYESDNVDYIIKLCDEKSLTKITQHSYHLIRFINSIENDSYFAYLSDQVHFCFYFIAMILIKTIKYLKDNFMMHILDLANDYDKELQIGKNDWLDIIKNLQLLIEKYGRVGGGNEDDIITKYKNGLNELLSNLFTPEELLHL